MLPHRYTQRVYCAGPLFNAAERREMVEIARVLTLAGFEPWVPHRDGMEFAEVHPYLVAQGYEHAQIGHLLHEAVFALDVYQVILGCGALVANLNGRVPDEGMVSETAMAYMLGKPIVLYKEDCRSMVEGRSNPLVVGMTGFKTVDEIEQIPEALAGRIAECGLPAEREWHCPPHLELPLARGGQLWDQLQAMGEERPSAAVAEVVLELFDPQGELSGSPR